MRRLITFGDSWTAGHGVETDVQYRGNPCKDNHFISELRKSNSWPRWLANKYDVPFINISTCGHNHVRMAEDIQEYKSFLEKDDLVIVMLSYLYRLPPKQFHKNDFFAPIHELYQLLESSPADFYFINSFCSTFVENPEKKNDFDISKFLDIDSTVGKYLADYEAQHNVSVWEYNSRSLTNEPNYEWGAFHPNLLGYKIIADYIYALIEGKKYECNLG
jgi:hypothetical protein